MDIIIDKIFFERDIDNIYYTVSHCSKLYSFIQWNQQYNKYNIYSYVFLLMSTK